MYYIRQLPRYKLFGYGIFFREIIERIEVKGGLISHSSNLRSTDYPKEDLDIIPWLMIDIRRGRLRCQGFLGSKAFNLKNAFSIYGIRCVHNGKEKHTQL
jgi:hypothetical protein